MKHLGLWIFRILETVFLFIFSFSIKHNGNTFTFLSVHFSFQFTQHPGVASISTNWFGFLLSLIGTLAFARISGYRFKVISIFLATAGLFSYTLEIFRFLNIIDQQILIDLGTLLLILDWVSLYFVYKDAKNNSFIEDMIAEKTAKFKDQDKTNSQ